MTTDAPLSNLELLRRFAADRGDEGFARELARRAVARLSVRPGEQVLDLGCGPGFYTAELDRRGTVTTGLELDPAELTAPSQRPERAVVGDGRSLPFPDECFDGILCSNMLEHTPEPLLVIDEIGRTLRPGGWAYVSWTNWLSPWGGHAIAPFHYLGAERGLAAYRRVVGEPTGTNLPYDGVWPLHIRTVLQHLDGHRALVVERVEPRYYPRLRPVMRIPGVREVLAWNCVIQLSRAPAGQSRARPTM